jgi:hypothetical protein
MRSLLIFILILNKNFAHLLGLVLMEKIALRKIPLDRQGAERYV